MFRFLWNKKKNAEPESNTNEKKTGFYIKELTPQLAADTQKQFDEWFRYCFSDYVIEKDVPASRLDASAHPACTPIQFLFIRDSRPVLAVVLVTQKNYRGKNVKGTQELCEKAGIRYIRFFMEYPNERDYVIDRVKSFLP